MITDKLLLVGSGLFGQVLRVVTFLVMGRFIVNESFGIWDLIIATTGLLGFGDLLLPRSLVQVRDRPEKEVISTTLAMGVTLFCFYALITLLAGVWLSYRYDNWVFLHVAAMWAGSQVITIVYNLQLSVLNRRMQFKHEALVSTASSVVGSISAMGMAIGGWGVYALAGQSLVAGGVGLGLTIWMLGMPSFGGATWGTVKRLAGQGIKASISNYAMNLQQGGVRWMVESIGGLATVGVWGRVIGVNQLFAQNIIAMLERVSFTTMCAAADDKERFREVLHQTAVIQLAITAFTGAWMFAGCDNLIIATIGPAWMDVPPLLKWLAVTVPVAALHITGYCALFAMGRTGMLAFTSVAEMVISLVLVFLMKDGGMESVAIAWTIGRVVVGLGTYAVSCRLAGAAVFSIVPTSLTLMGMAVAAGLAMVVLQPRFEGQLAMLVPAGAAEIVRNMVINGGALGLASVAGVGIYGGLLVLLQPQLFVRIKQLALRKR